MWGSVPREGRVRRIELGIALFSETASNYALEWFSEAGSAPIRSAVKFYFDIDVRKCFQLFQNIFFQSIQKLKCYFWKYFWKFSIQPDRRLYREKPQITIIKKIIAIYICPFIF